CRHNPQCGRGLVDSKRQVHRTDVATSPPTMWTAASSEIVACYYAQATRTVYRLEQHNPRSPTSTRVHERQERPETFAAPRAGVGWPLWKPSSPSTPPRSGERCVASTALCSAATCR